MSSIPHHNGSPSSSTASSPDVGSSRGKATGKPRTRRKVAKACLACQKSHLTCDDQRPCTRCVKKGIGDQCVEGVRKKAKYLLEGEERHPSTTKAPKPSPPKPSPPTQPPAPGFPLAPLSIASDRSFDGPARSPFDSALASTSPFSSMAQPPTANLTSRPSFGSADRGYEPPNTSSTGQFVPDDVWLAGPLNEPEPMEKWSDPFADSGINDDVPSSSVYPYGLTAAADEFQMFDAMFGGLSPTLATFSESYTNDPLLLDPATLPPQASQPVIEAPSSTWENKPMITPFDTQPTSQPTSIDTYTAQNTSTVPSQLPSIQSATWTQPDKTNGVKAETDNGGFLEPPQRSTRSLTPGEVYRRVLKPYDYTEGYHVLMDYLTKHFERKDILRVVHALASFRPSLIALQMPMSEDDEVFIERSFQRTMIELEKLISYSATPTAVWRRTGEICYANPEFCTLSGKDSGALYGKKHYIYHLFEKSSVITYWENFSVHAFENTTQNFFQPTTIKVNGKAIPCSCCFTIRRDVFDLPSVVIGQFLRIPGDI